MPRTVYVLGAGFSHNFNREMFPLIRDFLSIAKSRFVFDPDERHQDLAIAIRTYFGRDDYTNIEKVLSFLSASPLYNRYINHEQRSVIYDKLVKIIIQLLAQASDSPAESKIIGDTYERFARFLVESEVTIISFNYDLLVEKMLEGTFKWRRYDGYGAHIPVAVEAMPTSPHTVLHQKLGEDKDMKWSKVTVLKPHGSINWGTPIISANNTETIYQSHIRGDSSMDDFALETEFGSPFIEYFKPVIVPPVLDKSSWLKHPTFKVIWNMALKALEDAKQITFIGYSLRETDFLAEFLFRQGITHGSPERKITIVDPNASELLPRFRDVFSLPGIIVDFDPQNLDFVTYAHERLFTSEVISP
jgi:hypothetical protein